MLTKRCEFFQKKIIPNLESKFEEKKEIIMDILELGLFQCYKLIDEEIINADKILKEANKDIKAVANNFEKKTDEVISQTNQKKEKESNNLTSEIENALKEETEKFNSISKADSTKVDPNKGITLKMVFSSVSSAISGIAVRTGSVSAGESLWIINGTSGNRHRSQCWSNNICRIFSYSPTQQNKKIRERIGTN